MPLTYTNRKGVVYYFKQKLTKTGKTTFMATRKASADDVSALPPDYEIFEHPEQGMVYVRKKMDCLFENYEIEELEKSIKQIARGIHYKLNIYCDTITVYTSQSNSIETLRDSIPGFQIPNHFRDQFAFYQAVIRFVKEEGTIRIERYVFRGEGYWKSLEIAKELKSLANKYMKHLGRESFYDL